MLAKTVNQLWDELALPALREFIKIPAKSTSFDENWQQNGYLYQTCQLAQDWVKNVLPAAKCEIIQDNDLPPCLFIDIPSTSESHHTTAFYGHFDKQPEAQGWEEGLGPWNPVLRQGKLYGRGSSDDGYSFYMMACAIAALEKNNIPHSRCVGIFETQEESGSQSLPFYMQRLKEKMGAPSTFFVLDNHCGDYERLWLSTSLRGIIGGVLTVKTMQYSVHSGTYSGMVPDAFAISQALLNRVQDPVSGDIKIASFHTEIPAIRREQLGEAAKILGDAVWNHSPLIPGTTTKKQDNTEILTNMTWAPALTVIGLEGLPDHKHAANIVSHAISLKISIRVPPNIDLEQAQRDLEKTLTEDPPFGVSISWECDGVHPGWAMTTNHPRAEQLLTEGSQLIFNKSPVFTGQGGSIATIKDFEKYFPEALLVLTGVLGPDSNAHAPNECLDITYTKKLTHLISYYLKESV